MYIIYYGLRAQGTYKSVRVKDTYDGWLKGGSLSFMVITHLLHARQGLVSQVHMIEYGLRVQGYI